MTYPNQKQVQIAKRTPRNSKNLYATINLDSLSQAMNCLKGSGLKMWLQLTKNQDNYKFGLSRTDCESWGIRKDSYYDGIKDLKEHGYLRQSQPGSNLYFFYENALAENQKIEDSKFYFTENTKPAPGFQKTMYGIPKGYTENLQRNNIYNTDITVDNTSSDYRKEQAQRRPYSDLGF